MNDRFRFRIPITNLDGQFDRFIFCDVYHEPIHFIGSAIFLTPEQCIGLKDSNGKLIYEGDIILSNMEYGGTHFVIVGDIRGYCYDAVAVEEYEQYLKSNKSDLCFSLSATAYHIITDHGPCFVVGNIHENPELLEGK